MGWAYFFIAIYVKVFNMKKNLIIQSNGVNYCLLVENNKGNLFKLNNSVMENIDLNTTSVNDLIGLINTNPINKLRNLFKEPFKVKF
jgi:hypothetical protein